MKNFTFSCLLLISLSVFGTNSKKTNVQLQNKYINIGGVSVTIPLFDSSFVEVGNENRKKMEVLVPNTNRLLHAYVLSKDFPSLLTGSTDEDYLSRYAMIEVDKTLESKFVNSEDFNQLVSFVSKNDIYKSEKVKDVEKEINRRLEALDLSKLKIGQPTPLGCLFSKKNLYAQGILMAYEQNGNTKVKAILIAMIHVKSRYFMIFINSNYKGNETIIWLKNIGEKWGDMILRANQSQIRRK